MGQISDISNPWRDILISIPASFRGRMFHVESGTRSSGRRTVVHEYPKRANEMGPYAEDMGQRAIRFPITGYLIYRPGTNRDYVQDRIDLRNALEQSGPGTLMHPVFCPGGMSVMCENYTMTETRERGGYTQFEMSFVQAGRPGNSDVIVNTAYETVNQAVATGQGQASAMDSASTSSETVAQ